MTDILEAIDAVIDWDPIISDDAMRWRPAELPRAKTIVPAVDEWQLPHDVWLQQLLAEGLDGYAATAYIAWRRRRAMADMSEAITTIGRAFQREFEDFTRGVTEAFKHLVVDWVSHSGLVLSEQQRTALCSDLPRTRIYGW